MTICILQDNMLHIKIADAFVGVRNDVFHLRPLLDKLYKTKSVEFILFKINIAVFRFVPPLIDKKKRALSAIQLLKYASDHLIMLVSGGEYFGWCFSVLACFCCRGIKCTQCRRQVKLFQQIGKE